MSSVDNEKTKKRYYVAMKKATADAIRELEERLRELEERLRELEERSDLGNDIITENDELILSRQNKKVNVGGVKHIQFYETNDSIDIELPEGLDIVYVKCVAGPNIIDYVIDFNELEDDIVFQENIVGSNFCVLTSNNDTHINISTSIENTIIELTYFN